MPRTKAKNVSLIKHLTEEKFVVPLLMLFATVARFATITKASIWHDEGFTMMLIARNPAEIWFGSGRDVHPPLFYELLHYWTELFGRSELAGRSMSAVAGLATIYVCYMLVKRYFSRQAATIVLLLLAVAPFLIRYSQEARMYGLLGLFTIGGTYALLRYLEKRNSDYWLIVYALLMAAGLYTHYFTALVIAAHWLYVMTLEVPWRWRFQKSFWLSWRWLITNIGIVLLWLPWIPSFYGQFSRGQGISWIPKTTERTFTNSIWQNLTFTDAGQLPNWLYWTIPLALFAGISIMTWRLRHKNPQIKMLYFYTFVPILLTIGVSIVKPVYQDRYLVFAANGLVVLAGIMFYELIKRQRVVGYTALGLFTAVCLVGVVNVGRQASHTMGKVAAYVNEKYQPGDEIISTELYTYFDFSYYCGQCIDSRNRQVPVAIPEIYPSPYSQLRLNTTGGRPNGYGESALLFDRAEEIYRDDWQTIAPYSGRIWLVGKPGDEKGKPYWYHLPSNWVQIDQIQTNSSEARLYQVQ
jgi:4-amino-4-deoxy-L-arabinose transferase-like glycosyltransferase